MEAVDKYGMQSGIIKIVAPEEWKNSLPPIDDLIKRIRVRDPIKQEIMGHNGTYRQINILHQRTYTLKQWKHLCDQSEHQPPARRGERRANADQKPPRTRAAVAAAAATAAGPSRPSRPVTRSTAAATPTKKGRGCRATRQSAKLAKHDDEELEERPMTPVSPEAEKEEVLDSIEQEAEEAKEGGGHCEEEEDGPRVSRMGTRQSKPKTQSVSARRKYSRREGSVVIDEEHFKDFDYNMDISDFTPERCEELEKIYWKTLTYAPPMYGADLPGTLFDESVEIWNLNKLPNLLDVLGTKVPGVNTAYLYLGMWKATFAWHLEDVDLYSINYLHFGAPKQWYSIPQKDARRFEAAMKSIWPQEAKACDQFLRHKGFLISPSHLKQHYNITVNKCLSYPGEFVVTYPYGYHSGFNLGYNCAEAVNFALETWLPMGKIAKKCECAQAQDSVWVDAWEIERKLRGEESEYEETEDEEDEVDEVEDDDEEVETGLPSPPSDHTAKVKLPRRKRKRAEGEEAEPRVKKKIRVRQKPHAEQPCCLCPNDIPGAEILDTDDGRKAHRMCGLYIPETYVETVGGKEIIANVASIDKARLELKCLYCRSKKGACFQCSHKKCPRAYHATCAAAAGVFVEEGEVPVFGEDGTEYKEQAFEFSCRFHRTKRDRKFEGDALENDPEIRKAAKALKKNDICQLQFYRGDIFAGVVVENHLDEETLLIDVIPNGYVNLKTQNWMELLTHTTSDRVEVEWKWLLLPDPADFRLPKASPNAIPLPTCRKAQKAINAKRTDDEVPRKDEEFGPGYVWAEFSTCEPFRNRAQTKVDLSKENQIWYYLGETSTDAKAQYTENPAIKRHNPKSNFLESLPKPVVAPTPILGALPPQQQQQQQQQQQTGDVLALKQEKPYLYKPKIPVAPAAGTQAGYTTQTFTFVPASGPFPPQPSPAQANKPSTMSMYHHHGSPQGGQKEQPQQQQCPPNMQYQQPPQQPKNSSSLFSSTDRFAPVGGSNGFPTLPGLTWPPAHMKSGHHHHPQQQHYGLQQPQSRVGVAQTTANMPPLVPMTSSHLQPQYGAQQQVPGGAQQQQPQPAMCAYQKYSFFQLNHNRCVLVSLRGVMQRTELT